MKLKRPARGLQRLFAVVGDLALAFLLTSFLRAFNYYSNFHGPVFKFLSSVAGKDFAVDFSFVVYYYLIYFAIRLYTTLMFGVSVSQFIVGLRSVGGPKFVRIAGVLRVMVELILTPFIIFDFPVIKRKRSVKEVVTFTAIISTERVPIAIFGSFIISVFVLLSLWSPILEVVKVSAEISTSFDSTSGEYISKKSDFKSFTYYSSNLFKMKTFSSLDDNRFILIPSFEVIKKKKGTVIRPYLKVYDKLSKVEGLLRVDRKLKILKVLKVAKIGNPLLSWKYPLLTDKYFDNLKKYQTVDLNSDMEISSLIEDDAKLEITSLIVSALSLDIGNVMGHMFAHGPFIRGYILLRNKILNLSSLKELTRVSIEKIGNSDFLRFTRYFNMNSFGTAGGTRAKVIENYLPIHSNNVSVLQLVWEKSGEGLKSLADFKNVFLSSSEWYFDYNTKFVLPRKMKDMRVTHVLDYFTSKELDEKRRNRMNEYFYKYMFDKCKWSLQNEDLKLQKILENQIDRILEVVEMEKKRKMKSNVDIMGDIKFAGFMKSLLEALGNSDRGYFK